MIEEYRCTIDVGAETAVLWSSENNCQLKHMWRRYALDTLVFGYLGENGIVLRKGVVKVDVLLENGEVVWTEEPENFMPRKVGDGEERVWEIEEMAA